MEKSKIRVKLVRKKGAQWKDEFKVQYLKPGSICETDRLTILDPGSRVIDRIIRDLTVEGS